MTDDPVMDDLMKVMAERDQLRSALHTAEQERDEFEKLSTDMLNERNSHWRRAERAEEQVKELRAIIEAKDQLLAAYRLGDAERADRALTKLRALSNTEEPQEVNAEDISPR